MLLPTRNDFFEAVRYSYYVCIVPVLMAAVLFFRRLRDGVECKFLLAIWIWFWFTRALNGSPFFEHDFQHFYGVSLILPFFGLGPALTKTERTRFLDWLSAVFGGFYFPIGIIALNAFLYRTMYEFPILGGKIGIIREASYARIYFFDNHPNVTAYWYLISLFLMIYQFFHCEKKLWRIPIVFSAIVDLLVIAITYSRSIRVCMSMTFALLAAALLIRLLRSKPRFLCMAFVIPISLLVLAASYEGSALCADVMATLSYRITGIQAPSEAGRQNAVPKEAAQEGNNHSVQPMLLSSGKEAPAATNLRGGLVQSDPRQRTGDLNTLSSNRIDIWLGALQTIKAMPSILWKGQLCDDVMSIAHQYMTPDGSGLMPPHFHNELLQILMITGLPGLIFALFFFIVVLYRATRFFFCIRAPFAARILVPPVLATVPYFMLEACQSIDLRLLFYILMCGFVVGYAKECGDS